MEGDAGTSQLSPTDADETPDESLAVSPEEPTDQTENAAEDPADGCRPAHIDRALATVICAVLLVLAAGGAVGGSLALRSHRQSADIARSGAAALQAAKDCVAATHAPDAAAMSAAQTKIIQCSTGDFRAQASLYSGVLVDAYHAANVKVQVSDMRGAVERSNADHTFEILVAVRVKLTNSDTADREQGYRLRVQMAPDEGTYKVARLDQVTSS